MGIGERRTINKAGRVKKSRTITILVPTGERYPNGKKKYKQIVRTLGSVYEVNKATAKEIYEKQRSKHKKNKYHLVSPSLADSSVRYIEHKRFVQGKRSWQRDEYSLNNLVGHFGPDRKLSEIDSRAIDEYKKARIIKVTKKTINNELECLRNLYNLAITWEEYEGENPVSRAGLIRKTPLIKRTGPTDEEEKLLLKELPPSVAWIFKFGLNTGLRITEMINLEVDQIRRIEYFENGERKGKEEIVLDPTDTKSGKGRIVPLNSAAREVLREALDYNAGRSERVFLMKSRPLKEGGRRRKPIHGPLSEIRDGQPYSSRLPILRAMQRACKRLGIRRITPHDLRRGFASRLVESGANLLDAQEILGHTSIEMLKTYVTTSTSKMKAVEAIVNKTRDES